MSTAHSGRPVAKKEGVLASFLQDSVDFFEKPLRGRLQIGAGDH